MEMHYMVILEGYYLCEKSPTPCRNKSKYPNRKNADNAATLSKMQFSFDWMTNGKIPENQNNVHISHVIITKGDINISGYLFINGQL